MIYSMILTIVGLSLFEIITSIDNAVVNADVLSTMRPPARRWFLLWGFVIAVFATRGILPLIIIWSSSPQLSFVEVIRATFSGDQAVMHAIEASAPILLIGGGTFLIFLFFHWLFLEPKQYGLRGERFFHSQGAWFFAIISIVLAAIVWFALKQSPLMGFSAVLGSTAFFIIHGFRQYAQVQEQRLTRDHKMSDVSKIAYLEVLDTTFSIDGVVGAFAFTLSVPLILIGNGLGALVLRRLTVSNIDTIKRYRYLKNGAMYSILFLGLIMVADSFGAHLPAWISPVITFGTVAYFFQKSR